MKIILAIDSFKGSLTSKETESIVLQELKKLFPYSNIISIPIADGGEGFLSVISQNIPTTTHYIHAHNPCMEIIKTQYKISLDKKTAFIEMANINGLPLIRDEQKNPMLTSTFGTGEIIRDALDKGCKKFIIGIGGSATNDAGTGMLQALGYRFLDKRGKELGYGGQILDKIYDIDLTQVHKGLGNARFTVACDVKNPFCGPSGAANIFARQKGANDEMILSLDKGMLNFAKIIYQKTGKDILSIPGSGAAGGLGGGILAFLHAELQSGSKILFNICNFYEKINHADLIITGEGKIDNQTLMGKIPFQILQAGLSKSIPVIAIVGKAENINELKQAGFEAIYETAPNSMTIKEAMKAEVAKENIRRIIPKLASTHLKSFI